MKYFPFLCIFCLFFTACKRDEVPRPKGANQYMINPYVGGFNGANYQFKPDWFKEPTQVADHSVVITQFTPDKNLIAYAVGAYLDDWSQAASYELFIRIKGDSKNLLSVTLQGSKEVTGWYYRDVSAQSGEIQLEAGVEYEAGMILKDPLAGNAFAITTLVKNQQPILPFSTGSMLCKGTAINGQASANYRLDGVVDIGYYLTTP